MKQHFTKTVRQVVASGLVITSALLFAEAVSAWTGPTCAAPNCNVAGPVNIGGGWQVKSGGFEVNSSGGYAQGFIIDSGTLQIKPLTNCNNGSFLGTDASGNIACYNAGSAVPRYQ